MNLNTEEQKRDFGNAALIELMAAVLECENKFAQLQRAGWPAITRQQLVNRVVRLINQAEGV